MKLLKKYLTVEADSEAMRASLVRDAENFLRAGGSLTLSDWIDLHELEKAAFIAANDRVRAESICLQAFANRGPIQTATVASVFDGGDSLNEIMLNMIADQVSSELARGGQA